MKKIKRLARKFELQQLISQGWEDKIPGGLADKKKPGDFDPKQIEDGVKIEMEHTDDPETAKEITMDHLVEYDDYYTILKHVEHMLSELEKK